jgi:DNA-binding NarL/FixJ family response regulator
MNNLILASLNGDRLVSWQRGLDNFVIKTFLIDRLDTFVDDVVRIKPQVILLDFDLLGLNGSNGAASLRKLCAEAKTIIITSGEISEDIEWELFKTGVRGCCQSDIKAQLLSQVVMAVQRGELWIRRTLTRRLVDELGKSTSKNKAYRTALSLLNTLTQREYDIAVRVGNGESNKQIAQACAITERTVKAHLTEIFLKLGISDRLNLALVLSADNRSVPANPGGPLNGGLTHTKPLGGSRIDDIKT